MCLNCKRKKAAKLVTLSEMAPQPGLEPQTYELTKEKAL
jgi:hypothetical protein